MSFSSETIVAQATPTGYGGVAIIRVSGKLSREIAEKILGHCPAPRKAQFSVFKDAQQQIIDEGIAIFFPAPHSFTGEDILELQGHGGPVVVQLLIETITKLGVRLARPGEFSERAFLNHKIDLTQAEAIGDLIHAHSEQAARSAVRSLQGEFSQLIRTTVEKLIQLRLFVEAAIDFPEEEIDFIAESTVVSDLQIILEDINKILIRAKQGALLQEGIKVVIAGKPNAGKSSLLNCLSGKDSAIVTEIPGTTRDILREAIHIDGLPIHIIDTAGLRETQDVVEKEGVNRARKEIENADLILWVLDTSDKEMPPLKFPAPVLFIKNKIDLVDENERIEVRQNQTYIYLSVKFQKGIALLKQAIKQIINFNPVSEGSFIARRRHCQALERAQAHLTQGLNQLRQHKSSELLAEDLRQAQNCLNEITGEFTADDLLGKIFSTFCIGK